MDFRFTPELDAFRAEVRSFLDAELPRDWRDPGADESVNNDDQWD